MKFLIRLFFSLFTIILIIFLNKYLLNKYRNYDIESLLNEDEIDWIENELDSKCQWISIDRDYFFKRTSTFYFNDANLLTFTYFTHSNSRLKLIFYFKIELKNEKIIVKKISNLTLSVSKIQNYGISYIYYRFDNETYLQLKDNIKQFQIKIKDIQTNKTTKEFIQVRVKNMNLFSKDKKGVFLCSKCMYNTKVDDLNSVKWWIQMKKQAGYTKIGFCNNSIENNHQYTELFEEYKNFVELDQFNCLPNLYDLKNPKKYFLSYSEFAQLDNSLAYSIFDSVFIFYMNECYWSNIDKYRYVSIMDKDEIVFPRKLSLKKNSDIIKYVSNSNEISSKNLFEDLKCEHEENKMENYLDKLGIDINKNANSSFYFRNGIKFPNELFQLFFDSTEMYLNSSERKRNIGHKIEVINPNDKSQKFLLTISNEFEFNYTLKLLDMNKNIIKPFYESIKQKINIKKFNSFYTITGSSVHWVFGKTIHNTNRSISTEIHFNTRQIDATNMNIISGKDVAYVNDDLGHLSHFKKSLRIKEIPFFQLIPDLNYINCYFRPNLNSTDYP
ncbi:unnamed protein product [Brachionus calyciflorus]|uniref:Glycosyltransferase family 92 protein n=1 Tax=Brachionus calyciflorus TaxID=104777 RepID=A0A814BP41_9BILA|nr:unnamed protein product [Brachionus calyciflorus]